MHRVAQLVGRRAKTSFEPKQTQKKRQGEREKRERKLRGNISIMEKIYFCSKCIAGYKSV